MTIYYCDTSVLVKRHVNEAGSQWFRELTEARDTSLFTTQIGIVEISSALNRRLREHSIGVNEYRSVMKQARYLFDEEYDVVQLPEPIIDLTCLLLERHPLRSLDAIHLGTAVFVNNWLLSRNESELTFLATDHRLLAAAIAEGLTALDPSTSA